MSSLSISNHYRHYSAYPVVPELNRYIDCVWTERFSQMSEYRNTNHLIVPDNTVELVFTSHKIERRFDVTSEDAVICKSHVAGLKTKPQYVKMTGEVLLAVRFRPCGLYRFTNLILADTIDQSIPTEYLFGSDISILEDQLLMATKRAEQVALINKYFVNRLSNSKRKENELFDLVVTRIVESGGQVKIKNLSEDLKVSVKTIERRFQDHLGVSPKQYCRLIRFFQSLKTPLEPGDCLGSLAFANGYYDQMHFIKEVKRFTGLTPSEYFGVDRGIQGPIFTS